jgi:hypothetical protein
MNTQRMLFTVIACFFALALPAQAINAIEDTAGNASMAEQHLPETTPLMANVLWGN